MERLLRLVNAYGLDLKKFRDVGEYRGAGLLVPMQDVSTAWGFSYRNGVGNPYVESATALHYHGTNLALQTLQMYEERFTPSTMTSLVGAREEVEAPRSLEFKSASPFGVPKQHMPYLLAQGAPEKRFNLRLRTRLPARRRALRSLSKPMTESRHQLQRIQAVYNSIIGTAYQQGFGNSRVLHDRYVTATILKMGSGYRFIVMSGQHRLGVLTALGVSKVLLLPSQDFAPCLDLDVVQEWPIVRSRDISPEEAWALGERYFIDDGSGLAKRFNIPLNYSDSQS